MRSLKMIDGGESIMSRMGEKSVTILNKLHL